MKKALLFFSVIIAVGSFFILQKKCDYPLFDVNQNGKSVEACFQANSIINHEHKNSIMVEVVSPTANVSGDKLPFQDKSELALFGCQIIFQKLKKQPTHYELSAAKTLPNQEVISPRDRSLIITKNGNFQIIDRLFCITNR